MSSLVANLKAVIKVQGKKMPNRNRFYFLNLHCGKKDKPHNCGELEKVSYVTVLQPLENCIFRHEQLNRGRISGTQILHFCYYKTNSL